MDFERLFNQKSEDDYWDIVNEITSYLYRNSEDYKKNSNSICDILDDNDNLRSILEDNKALDLTKSEVEKLIEYINKLSEKNIMERKYIYQAGCRFTYFFLKNIGLLKEINTDVSKG